MTFAMAVHSFEALPPRFFFASYLFEKRPPVGKILSDTVSRLHPETASADFEIELLKYGVCHAT
jgi:hypothetical protein